MEISLPIELANPNISLSEIGAIFVLSSVVHMDDLEKKRWNNHEDLENNTIKLLKSGIMNIDKEENGNRKILFDLSKIHQYFSIENYDEFSNPIYVSKSPIKNADGNYLMWRVAPSLVGMNIVWMNKSDAPLLTMISDEYFDSLVEAEQKFTKFNYEQK